MPNLDGTLAPGTDFFFLPAQLLRPSSSGPAPEVQLLRPSSSGLALRPSSSGPAPQAQLQGPLPQPSPILPFTLSCAPQDFPPSPMGSSLLLPGQHAVTRRFGDPDSTHKVAGSQVWPGSGHQVMGRGFEQISGGLCRPRFQGKPAEEAFSAVHRLPSSRLLSVYPGLRQQGGEAGQAHGGYSPARHVISRWEGQRITPPLRHQG